MNLPGEWFSIRASGRAPRPGAKRIKSPGHHHEHERYVPGKYPNRVSILPNESAELHNRDACSISALCWRSRILIAAKRPTTTF
jgi:hypothetical protein